MSNRMEKQGEIKPEFVKQVVPNISDLEVYLLAERKQAVHEVTAERSEHILESHPEAKTLLFLLPDLVESPDFTQRNSRPYTVRFYKFYHELVVGNRTLHNKYLMCPVRLNVDLPSGYKHSIITFYLLRKPMEGEITWQKN
ncbi:hypothetical protein FJZ31_28965 [Candidatus Poribacteria bacterium]|nr:hypothetical protein [Candidatus Poribacteria bacterium]